MCRRGLAKRHSLNTKWLNVLLRAKQASGEYQAYGVYILTRCSVPCCPISGHLLRADLLSLPTQNTPYDVQQHEMLFFRAEYGKQLLSRHFEDVATR